MTIWIIGLWVFVLVKVYSVVEVTVKESRASTIEMSVAIL